MIKGYLESQDVSVGEHKISRSLQRVAPEAHEHRRQDTLDTTNPVPYVARYFGHKLHIDQNECMEPPMSLQLMAFLII